MTAVSPEVRLAGEPPLAARLEGWLARHWPLLLVEAGFLLAYVLLRTIDAPRLPLQLWTIGAIGVVIASPVSGLVLLAAIAPFSEPLLLTRELGVKPLLAAVLATSVAVRAVYGRLTTPRSEEAVTADARPGAAAWRVRLAGVVPWLPLICAFVVLAGTAFGVLVAARAGDPIDQVGQLWLAGVGGGLFVLLAAFWVARAGSLRPLAVAVASATLGGVVSLADFLNEALLRDGPLGWLLRPTRDVERLTGIIPSPNGVAALIIGPTAVLIAAAVLARDLRLRVLAAVAALPLLAALYFTYSRAALLSLFVVGVVVAWRLRRSLGLALLAAGLVAAIVLLPSYLRTRGQAVGNEGTVQPGQVFVASDVHRFTAWSAASRMWLDEPLIGHGFRSYHALGAAYGDEVLTSPHNEWLRLFAEEGVLVGLAGLGFVLGSLLWLSQRPDWLGTGLLGAFAGYCLAATFNNPLLFIQVSIIAFTLAGTGLARAGPWQPRLFEWPWPAGIRWPWPAGIRRPGGRAPSADGPLRAVPGLDAAAAQDVEPGEGEGEVDDRERARQPE